MSGMKVAGGGWSIETIDLTCTAPAGKRGDGILGRNYPAGDGAQLLVKRTGRVWFVRTVEEAVALGVPLAEMHEIARWN